MGENLPAPDPTAPQKGTLISVPLFHATGNHSAMGVATAMGMKVCWFFSSSAGSS